MEARESSSEQETARPSGVYLVVADDSDEFSLAMRYAARLAGGNGGHLGVLYVVEAGDFQSWGAVERMMKRELREKAEMALWAIARKVNDVSAMIPALYIGEGARTEAIIETVTADNDIVMVILGGSMGAGGPGPLVSYFTGKGIGRLRVPVLVVPGNLDPEKLAR